MSMARLSSLRDKRACRLLFLLILFSSSVAFLPIEAYLVPYLVREKHFTNYQVINKIFPISIYSTLIFTLLAAPACNIFSYWTIILVGTFMRMATFIIIRFGNTLFPMQIMQVTYGLAVSSNVVFSSYLFLLVTEDEFQALTSLYQGSYAAAFVLASEFGQLLVSKDCSFTLLLDISIISTIISCIVVFLLPKDQSHKKERSSFLLNVFSLHQEGLWHVIKETWKAPNLQLLSFWWAMAYGGFSLTLNYGTNLFEGISSISSYNGHVIAIGAAVQCLSSVFAIYLAKVVANTGGFLYIVGSGVVGIVCITMGNCKSILITYVLYIVALGIKGLLLCVIYAQCGSLLSNGQYILMFSFNTVLGLLMETLVQIVIEIAGLNIFSEYVSFGIYFLGFTGFFTFWYGIYFWRTGTFKLTSPLDENLVSNMATSSRFTECDPLIQN